MHANLKRSLAYSTPLRFNINIHHTQLKAKRILALMPQVPFKTAIAAGVSDDQLERINKHVHHQFMERAIDLIKQFSEHGLPLLVRGKVVHFVPG